MSLIKIFGERNTSTHAVRELIENNSRTRVAPSTAKELDGAASKNIRRLERAGDPQGVEDYIDRIFANVTPINAWKHTATTFPDVASFEGAAVVIMVRHPASWLLGLHRRPYHALQYLPAELGEFANTPWRTVMRENLDGATLTPLELYNRKIESYRLLATRLQDHGVLHRRLRFEDFASDQIAFFEELRPMLADARRVPAITKRSTKDPAKDWRYYQHYYGGELWRAEINDQAREEINYGVDWSALQEFDYYPLG